MTPRSWRDRRACARGADLVEQPSSPFSRNGLSSTLTVTLLKKASTWGRNFAMAVIAAVNIRRDRPCSLGLGDDRLRQRLFLGQRVERTIGAPVLCTIILFLDADDSGRRCWPGRPGDCRPGVRNFPQRLDAAGGGRQKIVLALSANTASTRSCRACWRSWTSAGRRRKLEGFHYRF